MTFVVDRIDHVVLNCRDVDTTTGRNLIDSMGTEVVVTDHAIRDVVPFEPLPYAEAVRRALEDTDGGR